MMEDLLDFRTFKETLGTNGFRDIKVSENSICCKAIICEHTIGLKGVLPETFPYEFPTIYIDEQSYANGELYDMPAAEAGKCNELPILQGFQDCKCLVVKAYTEPFRDVSDGADPFARIYRV